MLDGVWSLAAGAAIIVKAASSLFGWLFVPEDNKLKAQLRSFRRKHDQTPAYQVALGVLVDMSKTTTFPDGLGRSQIATHMAFMALNWLGCVVACVLLGRAHGYSLRAAYLYINLQGHFGVLLLAFVLAFLDRASLAIAAMQLKQISGLASPKVLLTQLLVGAFFFILAAIVSMATLHLVIEPRYYRPIPVWPGGLVWLTLSRVPELVSALPSRPSGYLLLLTAFGTLASLPIAIYGCALVAVLALRARWISWITQRTLRQISKDKAPVVSLVGNFLAGLAAIVALLTGHSK